MAFVIDIVLLVLLGIAVSAWVHGHNPTRCGFHYSQPTCRIRWESGDVRCFGEETRPQFTITSALSGVLGLLGVVQGVIPEARARR